MKRSMTVTEGAQLIEDDMLNSVKTARKLSKSRTLNLACFLKYNYGANLTGMRDEDWINEAKAVIKVAKK